LRTLLNLNIQTGGGKMKTKALVCGVVFIIVVLTGVCSFADDKEQYGFYVPSRNEELY
jgi:hypothetical protein